MSKLLINESPLLVLPSLAIAVGLNEAITLQQIHYWLDPRINKNFKEGLYWVYNSYEEWHKQFPFWSLRTIRRNIQSLEEKNLLITKNFSSHSFDKTKWYSINYKALETYTPTESSSGQFGLIDKSNKNSSISSNWTIDEDITDSSYKETKTTSEITTENSYSVTGSKKFEPLLADKIEERGSKLISIWNSIVEKKLGRETKVTSKRITLLNRNLSNFFNNDIILWESFCIHITKSKFLMGEITNFRIQLDWILKEDNLIKVIEGSYHREGESTQFIDSISENDEEKLVAHIKKSKSPDFWKEIMINLLKKIGYSTFNAWVSKNEFISYENGLLEIKAPSKFSANWQTDNFLNAIFEESKKTISDIKECIIKY